MNLKTEASVELQSEHNLSTIDLNCDLAQGWGAFHNKEEEALLPFVSSVNIACGAHAGDPINISRALRLAKEYNLAVGAHIGYPDLAGYGQRELRIDSEELLTSVSAQLGFLSGLARSHDLELTHVRPHGMLHQRCMQDNSFAEQLSQTIFKFSPWLIFLGGVGNYLSVMHETSGLVTFGEMYLTKFYRKDASLRLNHSGRPQNFEGALAQAKSLIFQNKVIVEGGRRIRTSFKSIHLSIDRPYALDLASTVSGMLRRQNRLAPLGHHTHRVGDLQPDDLTLACSIAERWVL